MNVKPITNNKVIVSTCVLYKCDLIVICREKAVLCDDLYLTVIHILMWAALNEACYLGSPEIRPFTSDESLHQRLKVRVW